MDLPKLPDGRVRLFDVADLGSDPLRPLSRILPFDADRTKCRGWYAPSPWSDNQVMAEWGYIVGSLLLRRGLQYGVGGMYLEFENTASPGDTVSAPSYGREAADGVAYYDGLADSDDRDFLRVPLVAGDLRSSDDDLYPKGNVVSFFAQTSGTVGVHGREFSAAANSVVFGGALVSIVDPQDRTRDAVLSRFYLAANRQKAKADNSQIGLEWELRLL